MGVYHLSGLGRNPGAVTLPLSCVYYLLKAAEEDNSNAKEMFEWSGELKNEKESLKGSPEALIMFTSKDVIECNERGAAFNYIDNWFSSTHDEKNVGKVIEKYIERLEANIVKTLKYICMVEVDMNDFSKTVEIVGKTIYALRNKEMWFNMTGGTNTINAALLISGLLLGASTRYYYVFGEKYLHPPWVKSPTKIEQEEVELTLKKWIELPVFFMDIEKLVELYTAITVRGGKIGLSEAKELLPGIQIEKVRGRILVIEKDTVSAGEFLKRIVDTYEKIKSERVENLTEWRKWAEEKQIIKVLRWEK